MIDVIRWRFSDTAFDVRGGSRDTIAALLPTRR